MVDTGVAAWLAQADAAAEWRPRMVLVAGDHERRTLPLSSYVAEVVAHLEDRHVPSDAATEGPLLPAPADFAALVRDLLLQHPVHALAAKLGPFWDSGHVQDKLALRSRQSLDKRRRSGKVLACKTSDGRWVYPVFQFSASAGDTVKVKPGVLRALQLLEGLDGWRVAELLRTPSPDLEGLSPLAWEGEGRDLAALSDWAESALGPQHSPPSRG